MHPEHEIRAARSRKLALVLGNGDYLNEQEKLEKPPEDARQMRMALRRLGFECSGSNNLGASECAREVEPFLKSLDTRSTALIYLSGHGIQVRGMNYFVPIDFAAADFPSVDKLLSINALVNQVAGLAATTIVFLDICRENPLIGDLNNKVQELSETKGTKLEAKDIVARGLADFSAGDTPFPGNVFLAYAAEAGEVAYEGTDDTSIFTSALLDYVETADLSLENLMFRVSSDVLKVTKEAQRPTRSSNLSEPFFFVSGSWLWVAANFFSVFALILSIFLLAIACYGQAHPIKLAALATVTMATLATFVTGISRSLQFSRGRIAKAKQQSWARNAVAGFLGSIIASPMLSVSYYFAAQDQIDVSFGELVSEVTIACVFAGSLLSALSYGFAERQRLLSRSMPSPVTVVLNGILGGIIAGCIVGPPVTIFFGDTYRPNVEPNHLLPGGFLGVVVAAFSIVTYSFERLNRIRIVRYLSVCLVSTAFVATSILAAFWLGQDYLSHLIGVSLGRMDITFLAVVGLIIGPTVGISLGAAISLTCYLSMVDDRSGRMNFELLVRWFKFFAIRVLRFEPHRDCRRLQLLRRLSHYEQDNEQVFNRSA